MPESISSINSPSGSPGLPSTTAGRSGGTTISSDFETFLLMLTAQLENQDPLNPIESQDFAVQLATFSSVEQQVLTNDLLRDLNNGLGASALSQLAGWVGMEARVVAPVQFTGTPVEIAYSPDPGSDAAALVVTDRFGRQVSRELVPLGEQSVLWAGTALDGAPLPPGQYTISLESMNQGTITSTREIAHYARIGEARQSVDGVDLVLEGGSVVPSTTVSALREPQGS